MTFLLTFVVSFLLGFLIIFGQIIDVEGRGEVRFNVKGEAASFEGQNNLGKLRVTLESLFIQPPLDDMTKKVNLELESDNQVVIKKFSYKNIGNNILYDSKTFNTINRLTIESNSLLINPTSEVTAIVYSDNFSIEGGTHNLAFPNTKNLKIIIPKGTTDYLIKFPSDSRVWLDEIEIIPIEGWNEREITLTLDSIGGRAMNIEEKHFVMTNWNKLSFNSENPLDLYIYDIDGKIGIDEPKVISKELSIADDLKFSGLTGEFVIERLVNSFNINSRGFSELIELNGEDITKEEWSLYDVGILVGIIVGIIAGICVIILFIIKIKPHLYQKWLDRKNKKFVESGEMEKLSDTIDEWLNKP